MPRKVGTTPKSVPARSPEHADEDELLDVAAELEARDVATLAVSSQSGGFRRQLNSDDADYHVGLSFA